MLVSFERATISQSHGRNSSFVAGSFRLNIESEQVPRFATGVNFFHHSFDLFRSQSGGDDVILEWNQLPNVVYRLWAGLEVFFFEDAMHCAVDRHVVLSQLLQDRCAN